MLITKLDDVAPFNDLNGQPKFVRRYAISHATQIKALMSQRGVYF